MDHVRHTGKGYLGHARDNLFVLVSCHNAWSVQGIQIGSIRKRLNNADTGRERNNQQSECFLVRKTI